MDIEIKGKNTNMKSVNSRLELLAVYILYVPSVKHMKYQRKFIAKHKSYLIVWLRDRTLKVIIISNK